MKSISQRNVVPHGRINVAAAFLILITFDLALTGCATWHMPAEFDDSVLRSDAVSEEIKGVRLSATVLSRGDGMRMLVSNSTQRTFNRSGLK